MLGFVSRNVVLPRYDVCSEHAPVSAVVLVQGELIHDIVRVPDSELSVLSLSSRFANCTLLDFEDMCISPGIIDCNVQTNGDWEGFRYMTKAAVSGGVTFVLAEANIYGLQEDEEPLFCDVGRVARLQDGIQGLENVGKDVFALKTYMFPPSGEVKAGVIDFPLFLGLAETLSLPLFIDASYPSSRLLYMASPCRFLTLQEREKKTEFAEEQFFAGAFPEDLNPNSDDEEGAGMTMTPLGQSLFSPESTQQSKTPSKSTDLDEWKPTIRSSKSIEAEDVEFKKPQTIARKKTTMTEVTQKRNSVKLKTIYEDLWTRIEEHEGCIEDLSKIEQMAYQNAGETKFSRKKRRSISAPADEGIEGIILEEEEKGLGSQVIEPPIKSEMGKKRKPKALMLKKPGKQQNTKEKQYLYHLANHPDHWEANGVETVLQALKVSGTTPRTCSVHFSNLSSASAINKVTQTRSARLTVETSPHYLFFSTTAVNDGDTRFKCNPPIRNKANCNLLWDLLKMGQIDVLASHHCAVAPRFKFLESGSFKQAVPGVSGLGFTLQAVWTRLRAPFQSSHDHSQSYLMRLTKWMSVAPAQILGLSEKRGSISIGKYADLVIWAPNENAVGQSYSKYPEMSPYHGVEMRGKVYKVYVRGKLAFDSGQFHEVGAVQTRSGGRDLEQ